MECGESMDRRTIKDFPNYNIDRNGIVKNRKGRVIKPEISNTGYERVSLSNEDIKHKKMSVHRLVAETFIPNPRKLPQVNHINENKTDNRVDNLEWSTPLHNLEHSRIIEKASVAKFTKIRCITTGKIYNSVKEAADEFGLAHSNIVACCNGRRSKCGGLEWEYVE